MTVVAELCLIYHWSDPEKIIEKYSLDQLISFREYGWEAKETEARLFWGILGEIMTGKKPRKQDNNGFTGLKEFEQAHPEAGNKGPAWVLNK
jgi:hypothetical protein